MCVIDLLQELIGILYITALCKLQRGTRITRVGKGLETNRKVRCIGRRPVQRPGTPAGTGALASQKGRPALLNTGTLSEELWETRAPFM